MELLIKSNLFREGLFFLSWRSLVLRWIFIAIVSISINAIKFDEITVTFQPIKPSKPTIIITEKKQLEIGIIIQIQDLNTYQSVAIINKKTPTPKYIISFFIKLIISSAIIGIPPKNIWVSFSKRFITFLISNMFSWFFSFKLSLYLSISALFLNFNSFILGLGFKLIIIPVVFPSSLITKFLKTGLDNISSNPALILIFSSFNVLNFFSFSLIGWSVLLNNGISRIVITLWTQSKLCILYFKLSKLFTTFFDVISSLGV